MDFVGGKIRRGFSNGKLRSLVTDDRDDAGVIERRGGRDACGWLGYRIDFEVGFFVGIFGGNDGHSIGAFLTTSLPIDNVDDEDTDGDRVRIEFGVAEPKSITFNSETDISTVFHLFHTLSSVVGRSAVHIHFITVFLRNFNLFAFM